MATVFSGSGVFLRRTTFTALSLLLLALVLGVLLVELVDLSGDVKHPVLAREERVAVRAYLDRDVLFRGAGRDYVAAGAGDLRLQIVRVYAFFHGDSSCIDSGC